MKNILIIAAIAVALNKTRTSLKINKVSKKKPPLIVNKNMKKTWDRITNERIKTLHPKLQNEVTEMINTFENTYGIKLRVTSALRTFSEQNGLFAKGRTTAGNRVTNARGGQSYHNYGLAFDIVPIIGGRAIWNKKTIFEEFAEIAKSKGWEWGGDFRTITDLPHFQKTFGYSTKQLAGMHDDVNPYLANV